MTLRFDRDRELPHVVTFPFSELVSDILDPDRDLQDFSHPSLTGHDFNATPSISGLGPCDQAPPRRDRDLPGTNEKAAGVDNEEGEGSDNEEGMEDDSDSGDEGDPFTRNVRDKSFYRKRVSYYYYRWVKQGDILEPPAHPVGLTLDVDTLFLHWNAAENRGRAWRWVSATEAQTGAEGDWVSVLGDSVDDAQITVSQHALLTFSHIKNLSTIWWNTADDLGIYDLPQWLSLCLCFVFVFVLINS
ncbi:hypothetical protein FA13DRAFT_1803073 [Coprinellus micaceus]|uniref:Uncharacterized protein n=1 Tax=Coprinellus micaceus TaxID=71717 RepID=A0A4Y7SBL3_COPMI|nr:hypothetical protein FA13DRAFT_1803073 [Coprinellus micaceus]